MNVFDSNLMLKAAFEVYLLDKDEDELFNTIKLLLSQFDK